MTPPRTIGTYFAAALLALTLFSVVPLHANAQRTNTPTQDGPYTDLNGRSCNRSSSTNSGASIITESCTNADKSVVTCVVHMSTGVSGSTVSQPQCTTTAADGTTAPSTGTSVLTNGATKNTFVPLTNLPGVNEAGNAATLPNFLNNLYKLAIGAAAVIAILQIMRAGVYFMFNKGSVAQNEQAKSLIQNAVLGLILVLSPAIVFGIINPDILKLNIDVSKLQVKEPGPITNNDLSAINQQQCSAFDPSSLHEVCSRASSNQATACTPDATCPAGETKAADVACCSVHYSGSICCGKVASEQYVLAWTYVRKNNDGTKCRVTPATPYYYAALGAGNASITGNEPGSAGCNADVLENTLKADPSITSYEILKRCEKMTTAYTFPDQYRQNACGTAAAASPTAAITVYVTSAQGTGAFNESSLWQGQANLISYNKFANACHASPGSVHALINPALVSCGDGSTGAAECRKANLTCIK